MFVVVNFDALAQASDIRIERRQVVFRCWKQDSNPRSQTPIRLQTECLLTNRLSYRGSTQKKLELDSPSLWSASIQPTRPHCQLAFAPGSGDIHVCCCQFRCSGTGKRYSNRKETSCLPLLKAGFEPNVSDTYSPADWMPADKPTELSRIKLKNLNSTARPYDQQAFSPLDLTASWLSHLALAIYMKTVRFYVKTAINLQGKCTRTPDCKYNENNFIWLDVQAISPIQKKYIDLNYIWL